MTDDKYESVSNARITVTGGDKRWTVRQSDGPASTCTPGDYLSLEATIAINPDRCDSLYYYKTDEEREVIVTFSCGSVRKKVVVTAVPGEMKDISERLRFIPKTPVTYNDAGLPLTDARVIYAEKMGEFEEPDTEKTSTERELEELLG